MLLGVLKRLRSSRRAQQSATLVAMGAVAAALALAWPRPEQEERKSIGPLLGKKADEIADNVELWVNGRELELKKERGKAVLLYFWHPADGRSLATVPRVVGLARAFEAKGLVTVGVVALTEPPELDGLVRAAEALARAHAIPFRLAIDCDGDVHHDYRIDQVGTPWCTLVNTAGVVAWEGPPDDLTEAAIRKVLPKH